MMEYINAMIILINYHRNHLFKIKLEGNNLVPVMHCLFFNQYVFSNGKGFKIRMIKVRLAYSLVIDLLDNKIMPECYRTPRIRSELFVAHGHKEYNNRILRF